MIGLVVELDWDFVVFLVCVWCGDCDFGCGGGLFDCWLGFDCVGGYWNCCVVVWDDFGGFDVGCGYWVYVYCICLVW